MPEVIVELISFPLGGKHKYTGRFDAYRGYTSNTIKTPLVIYEFI